MSNLESEFDRYQGLLSSHIPLDSHLRIVKQAEEQIKADTRLAHITAMSKVCELNRGLRRQVNQWQAATLSFFILWVFSLLLMLL